MIVINPLLPFFPDSISFLIYGLVTGLLLKFWRIAKKHFFLMPFFLVPYFAWAVIMFAFITVQPQERKIWFLFGFALTFIKIFSIIWSPFVFVFETITEGIQERRADRRDRERQQQREQESHNYQDRDQDIRAEQARREAEARANRARQSGTSKGDHQGDREKVEDKKQQSETQEIKPAKQKRSYDQVLGLLAGWTEEDLKKAYQREANRTHPDKWIGKPQAMRGMMEVEYKAVQEAYRKLKK